MPVSRTAVLVGIILTGAAGPVFAQYAELSGRIRDSSDAVIANARVSIVSKEKGVTRTTSSNDQGVYALVALPPDEYVVTVQAEGFRAVRRDGVVLTVDQRTQLDFTLHASGVTEEVTVKGGAAGSGLLKSIDGSVGMVIDRRFAANLPVNGRMFNTLIGLAPGAAPSPILNLDGGQFAINGQRGASNYFMVDGVSAQSGMGLDGDAVAGQLPASTVTGGLNGLVSMDALQEFRIQTSSFAPEFGRTPGGQISLVTRSGTNRLTGSVFEQFRDEALSANNWFANSRGLGKAPLSQHQFGGALGGPLVPNRLFYFASYEGLRLEQPSVVLESIPSLEARQSGPAQALLAAYPEPTGPTRADLSAEYAANVQSDTSTDTLGLRVDYAVKPGTQVFTRYSHAPSSIENQNPFAIARLVERTSRSISGGVTSSLRPNTLLDVRATYGDDTFSRGSAPRDGIRSLFPASVPPTTALSLGISGLAFFWDGMFGSNTQTHLNVVGSLSRLVGTHHLKVGVDYRRIASSIDERDYVSIQTASLADAMLGQVIAYAIREFPRRGVIPEWSAYVQDTWRATERLSLTYGARWDVNPAPSFRPNEGPLAVVVGDTREQWHVSPERGVPMWKTSYGDVAPRAGFSYAIDARGRLVLSGGVGVFHDLQGQAAALAFSSGVAPNRTEVQRPNLTYPVSADAVAPIPEPRLTPPFSDGTVLVDPELGTPQTRQWNLSLERQLGETQAVSITYVEAHARQLLHSKAYWRLNEDFTNSAFITDATGRSRYRSMQVHYRRRSSTGLQVLVTYSLGKAQDTVSTGFLSDGNTTDHLSTASFDVRHMFNTAVSWDLPSVAHGPLAWALQDWGLHVVGTARSGLPFSVDGRGPLDFDVPGRESVIKTASLVPGADAFVDDPLAPGGRRLNREAFVSPPGMESGNTERNGFRWIPTYQVDMGLQRTIRPTGGVGLQIRVDAFNVLNTPSFGLPQTWLFNPTFGLADEMANDASARGRASGLYRQGGPRSVELSLRVEF